MSSFPSPIGGTTLSSDFAPCIVFSVLFGLIVPFLIYRLVWKRSRCFLLIGPVITLAERPVVFAIKANQSRHLESLQNSSGLMKYLQLSFALGYIGLTSDLCKLLRAMIVNASSPLEPNDSDDATTNIVDKPGEDHPRIRFWTRRITDFYGLAYLAATVPGLLSGLQLKGAIDNDDPPRRDRVMALRYASSSVHLLLTIILMGWTYWAMNRLPRIRREAGWVLITICAILCIPGIYRLGVMHNRTVGTTLATSPDTPGALNKPGDKALFYIFHIVPEYIVAILMFVVYNVRELFGTGPAGDVLWRDLTPEEKEKIKKKKEEKAAKKAAKKGLPVEQA